MSGGERQNQGRHREEGQRVELCKAGVGLQWWWGEGPRTACASVLPTPQSSEDLARTADSDSVGH